MGVEGTQSDSPLSIVSSIAGILTLLTAISATIWLYWNSHRDAKKVVDSATPSLISVTFGDNSGRLVFLANLE